MIPFMRARTIEIDATNLKPKSNHFIYFDNIDVNKYVRPLNANYSQDGGTTSTSGLKTDGNGRCRAYFDLPNNGVERFATGQRDLKVTSSLYNESNPSSQGVAQFSAQGLLQTNQTELISTRNGRTVQTSTSSNRQITRRGEAMNAQNVNTDPTPFPLPEPPPAAPVVVPPAPPQPPEPLPAPPPPEPEIHATRLVY